jgi:hypothetical protein
MKFQQRWCAAALAVGAAAVAIAASPAAAATPSGPICNVVGGGATLCRSNGNAQLHAGPTVRAEPQYGVFGLPGLLFHN